MGGSTHGPTATQPIQNPSGLSTAITMESTMRMTLTAAAALIVSTAVIPLAARQARGAWRRPTSGRPAGAIEVTRDPPGSLGDVPAGRAEGHRGHAQRQLGQRHRPQDDEGRVRSLVNHDRASGAAALGILVHGRRRQGARSQQRRDAARRCPLRQPADDLGPGIRVVGLQGRAARHGPGGLVSVANPQAGEPADDGLHAAGLRDRDDEVSGALPAARRRR